MPDARISAAGDTYLCRNVQKGSLCNGTTSTLYFQRVCFPISIQELFPLMELNMKKLVVKGKEKQYHKSYPPVSSPLGTCALGSSLERNTIK